MSQQMRWIVSLILLTTFVLSGCQPPADAPDLVPIKAPGAATFCDTDEAGNLKVYVQNQGTADAPSSEVEVKFYMGSGVEKTVRGQGATGPISKGATATVLVPIPAGCFNPDCDFIITVDIVNEVKESNEQNNSSVQSTCVG